MPGEDTRDRGLSLENNFDVGLKRVLRLDSSSNWWREVRLRTRALPQGWWD